MGGSAVMTGYAVRAEAVAPHRNPTCAEIEALLAVIDQGDVALAARSLGLKAATVQRQLATLYTRLGVTTRIEAVRILWPVIGEHVTIFGRPLEGVAGRSGWSDRRLGVERRRTAA